MAFFIGVLMKKSRFWSFVLVTAVYILAIASGVAAYIWLPYSMPVNLFLADVIATAVTFIFSVILGNASVYDPYWSVQPIVILTAFALNVEMTLAGWLAFIAVWLWGARLTANWAYTFHGLEHQDWRYTMLKQKTGVMYPFINFLGIHLFPTIVVFLCEMPAVYLMSSAQFNAWNVAGFIICLVAVTLQLVSDVQMQAYRKNRSTPFIRTGLWKHSRHPNYLGEILMWWGIAVMATLSIGKWYFIIGALVNTLMFLFVSIPMADNRQSKKDGFEEYKRQTRMLFPFPKKVKEAE